MQQIHLRVAVGWKASFLKAIWKRSAITLLEIAAGLKVCNSVVPLEKLVLMLFMAFGIAVNAQENKQCKNDTCTVACCKAAGAKAACKEAGCKAAGAKAAVKEATK